MENIIQSSDSLRFVTPSHEIVDIEISSWSDSLRGQKYFDQLIVTDLKYKLSQLGYCACNPDRIRIILMDEEVSDETTVRSLVESTKATSFSKQQSLLLVIKMQQEEVSKFFNFQYQDFVRSVFPPNRAEEVPLDIVVQIDIGINIFHHTLYVPSLLDDNIVSDSRQLAARSEQSMLAYFDGNLKEAAKRGYRQWLSDDDCPSLAKVLLLLVDQIDQDICMAAQQAEELTYSIFGINDGYEGCDKHSWQRYTSHLPVDCKLSSDFMHTVNEPGRSCITIQPVALLRPGQCYAVLLRHHAVAMPAELLDAELPSFGSDGLVANDYLSFFKTADLPTNTTGS